MIILIALGFFEYFSLFLKATKRILSQGAQLCEIKKIYFFSMKNNFRKLLLLKNNILKFNSIQNFFFDKFKLF